MKTQTNTSRIEEHTAAFASIESRVLLRLSTQGQRMGRLLLRSDLH